MDDSTEKFRKGREAAIKTGVPGLIQVSPHRWLVVGMNAGVTLDGQDGLPIINFQAVGSRLPYAEAVRKLRSVREQVEKYGSFSI